MSGCTKCQGVRNVGVYQMFGGHCFFVDLTSRATTNFKVCINKFWSSGDSVNKKPGTIHNKSNS